jgi:hypothetical protein
MKDVGEGAALMIERSFQNTLSAEIGRRTQLLSLAVIVLGGFPSCLVLARPPQKPLGSEQVRAVQHLAVDADDTCARIGFE